jgi:hypothetical protein
MTDEMPEQDWGLFARVDEEPVPEAPDASEDWDIPSDRLGLGGFAKVWYAKDHTAIQRPVIMSDGFNSGPTKMNEFYHGVNGGEFPFATALSEAGYDLILLGYNERSASILENAKVARNCIMRTIAERLGGAPLVVGGFSMGGLITRYTLAKMENDGLDHQTSVYFSWDSPHRGAWIPTSLQALAHFMTAVPALSKQINSPAARQLLWRHIETVDGTPEQDPLRTEFLAELEQVGNWPRRPRLLGLANGRGDGIGLDIPAGDKALDITAGLFKNTSLWLQKSDPDFTVAHLKAALREEDVESFGLPELDTAPGGVLDSFAIAADNINKIPLNAATAYHDVVGFVPTISAVSVRDIAAETIGTVVDDLEPDESDLDDYVCSSTTTMHSRMTVELGQWLLDRMPSK